MAVVTKVEGEEWRGECKWATSRGRRRWTRGVYQTGVYVRNPGGYVQASQYCKCTACASQASPAGRCRPQWRRAVACAGRRTPAHVQLRCSNSSVADVPVAVAESCRHYRHNVATWTFTHVEAHVGKRCDAAQRVVPERRQADRRWSHSLP